VPSPGKSYSAEVAPFSEAFMDPTSPSFTQLAARLTQVERYNRWLGRSLLCLLALGGLGLLGAAQAVPSPAGSTEPLALRDGAGNVRARFEAGPEGTTLQFLDDQGKPLASLVAGQDALVLRHFNRKGRFQTGVALEHDGIAVVSYDGDGRLQTGRGAVLETSGLFGRK
jgi:hypothetical protein